MPETALGLFPDIGASYFLSRLPGFYGDLFIPPLLFKYFFPHIAIAVCYAKTIYAYVLLCWSLPC